jgi:DUF971 family protein
MGVFRFTESQWDEISTALGRTGRLQCEEDRQILEMICEHFAQLRPRLGYNVPTPIRARNAWRKVAAAAQKLDLAIADLRAAGAADFTFLDNHQGGWASWSAQLHLLKQEANWAAELEMAGVHKISNKADPMRDAFVNQLATIWKDYGGRISNAEDGPLIRFLSAVTAPALIWTGEKPMKAEALKWSVRRIGMASWLQK